MGKKSGYLSIIMSSVIFTFFLFATIKVLGGNSGTEDVKNQILLEIEQNTNNVLWAGIMVKTLDDLTPKLRPWGVPFTDKNILLVNEFPLIGWSHVIVIYLLMGIFTLFVMLKKIKPQLIILVGLLIIFLSYIIGTLLDYYLYLYSAHQLDISKADALAFMASFNNGFDNVMLPIMLFSLMGLFIIMKFLYKAMKARKK